MSRIWQDSLFLLKRELGGNWKYFIWNLVFMVYTGSFISLFIHSIEESDAARPMSALLDYMFLVMIPLTGLWFCRSSFRYLREDSYTQKLLYFKTLPIPLRAIVLARVMQGLCAMVFNGIILYPIIYFLTGGFSGSITGLDFFPFIMTWFGYSLMVTGYYIYFEFLRSGRTYMWMSFAYMGISTGITAVAAISDVSLIRLTIDAASRNGFMSPVMWISLAVGALMLYLASRLIVRKIEIRDLV